MRVLIENIDFDNYLVYLPDSLKFFTVNGKTAQLIELISKNKKFTDVNNILPDVELELYNRLLELLSYECDIDYMELPAKVLSRLVINISNTCNLQCKYCYANGGVYLSECCLMSEDTLNKILNKFYSIFEHIGVIQLFGGEPLLNYKFIKIVGEFIKSHEKNTIIGIVTNGTLMSDEIIDLIKKYNVTVTVSLDHYLTHDLLRPLKNEGKSFELIVNNIKSLQSKAGQPTQIEATYTKLHEDMGISVMDVVLSIQESIGNVPVHIAPVCTDDVMYKLSSGQSFVNSIDDYFKLSSCKKDIKYSFIDRFASAIKSKKRTYSFCNAGYGTISVSCDGKIYPCFYFIDNEDFLIADINEDLDSLEYKINIMRNQHKRNFDCDKCKDCFANSVCFGCLGVNYTTTGNELNQDSMHCDMVKGGLKAFLINMAKSKRRGN